MKRHVWILFIALNSFCCHQQKKTLIAPNDLFFANLKGNIEKVEETSYGLDSTGREMPPDSCCRSIILYDDKGFRISHSNVDIDGNERTSQQYTGRFSNGLVKEIRFSENGKLTSLLSGTLNKKGSHGDTHIYDSSGKLLSYYTEIEVNEFDRIISMKNFNPDSTLQQVVVNHYSGNIWTGGYVADNTGKQILSTLIKLNEKMNPVEQVQIMFHNSLPDTTITKYIYSPYDNHENWIQRIELDEKRNARKLIKRQIVYRK